MLWSFYKCPLVNCMSKVLNLMYWQDTRTGKNQGHSSDKDLYLLHWPLFQISRKHCRKKVWFWGKVGGVASVVLFSWKAAIGRFLFLFLIFLFFLKDSPINGSVRVCAFVLHWNWVPSSSKRATIFCRVVKVSWKGCCTFQHQLAIFCTQYA